MTDETTGGGADNSSIETNRIIEGDVVETLANLPESSVHMAMCSPPYYGLRDYGEDGQIGLEGSLDEYIQNLVEVGEQLKRVLRDDGSWWLNLGDTFNDSKNKLLVPHRVVLALQKSGWIVRNDVVWKKTDPMPESVKDRLSTTHEFVFHLANGEDYYYDLDAIRSDHKTVSPEETRDRNSEGYNDAWVKGNLFSPGSRRAGHPNGKNPGDVFEVPSHGFPDAHFAVYPPQLCKKPIKATSPKDGIVLDPFVGAGTTCLVAKRLGRRFVGIDLNPEYVAMAQKRCGLDVDNPSLIRDDDSQQGMEVFTDGG